MTEQQKAKNTERILLSIAARLAGRSDLRHCNYQIDISSKDQITMTPLIYVYPNRYRRCESDKVDIVSFILNTQMNELDQRSFVPGEYIYQSSFDKKRRQWARIK